MQLRTLYIHLGRMIEHGHGRALVAVDKDSFRDNRESDGCTILPLSGFKVYPVPQADDDGGTTVNKDGTERYRKTCVLFGSMGLTSSDADEH
jgi:hypothetical protein